MYPTPTPTPTPAYRWTEPYPHHTNPLYYAPPDHDHDPRPKHIPSPPMNTTLNPPYQPWPYGFNYCYPPAPQEYHHHYNHNHNHGCCNHGCFGGGPYSFQPPYPHYPPTPSPFPTHGFYPGTFPSYSVPPPHYSIEQPRYDYDKTNHPTHHCCGCNHREDENKSREDPKVDKKTSDSLVPLLFKDCPYPIMWVPPRNMNTESKAMEKDKPLEPSKQVENGEIARDQQSEDGSNCFPFPIFWLPSKNNQMVNDNKENNLDLVAHKGLPNEKKNDEGSGDSETRGKHVVQKVIPVKQSQSGTAKGIEKKAKSDSMEKTGNGTEGKGSPKTSKLPPVCLRIDPLPRKKSSSRSPSPPAPGHEERSKGSPVASPKCCQQQTQLECLKKSKEEQSKGNIKPIEVANAANKIEIEKDGFAVHGDNVPKGEENESKKGLVQSQSSECEPYKVVEEKKKKNLSEHEAALIIQSVYRGFEVRKSHPLMKLRQISQVRKQVVELRNRIQDLESSSTTRVDVDVDVDDKQKLIIGETIMSLLLRLDTIQGLHPIVRDFRKSVAKELVGLQEKLDSLAFVKSETVIKETMSCTEQEKSDRGQDQLDSNVKLVESGSGSCDNHQVGATINQDDDDDGEEGRKTNIQPKVELYNGKCNGELNNNHLQVSVETEQAVDDAIQTIAQSQSQSQSDSINGVKSVDIGGLEGHDIKAEQLVEQNTKELDCNQLEIPVESDQPQPVESVIQERPVNNVETMESNSDICEHNKVETAESEDVVTEARDINLKPQVESESQLTIVEKSNQLEIPETEQPVDQEKWDQTQVELHNEKGRKELNNNQIQVSVQTKQPVDDAIEEKLNHALTQSDSINGGRATNYLENGDVGGHDIKLEHNTIELISNQAEIAVETEQPVENAIQEKSDLAQASSGSKVETAEYEDNKVVIETRDINLEPQVEYKSQQDIIEKSKDQLDIMDAEQSVEQEKSDQTQAQFEGDAENVEWCEHPEVEAIESQDDGNVQMKVKLPEGDEAYGGIQEDLIVPSEEAPKSDDVESSTEVLMEDVGGIRPPPPVGVSDRKLMEENEKLRVAVEELMKAGNEQLNVIKELAGKVKDLEKKLSRKKKIKVNKCKSRGGDVQEELRDCLV